MINLKLKFLIENCLSSELYILTVIFNDIKIKGRDSDIPYEFYIRIITNEINKINKKLKYQFRLVWEKAIKQILLYKETKNLSLIKRKGRRKFI